MIAANELRKGSWISVDGVYTCLNVLEIFYDEIVDPVGELEGIVLTPEILEKAGFEQGKIWDDVWAKNGVWITEVGGPYYLTEAGKGIRYKPFKYLHQLQNLFFALTGEELNVQL